MTVTVRLSAGLARLAGTPRLQLIVQEGTTVAGLLGSIADQYPALAPQLRLALPVVRGDPVGAGQVLARGDELALLVPVAGG
jgi:molybdopterin converting factor small subunit